MSDIGKFPYLIKLIKVDTGPKVTKHGHKYQSYKRLISITDARDGFIFKSASLRWNKEKRFWYAMRPFIITDNIREKVYGVYDRNRDEDLS